MDISVSYTEETLQCNHCYYFCFVIKNRNDKILGPCTSLIEGVKDCGNIALSCLYSCCCRGQLRGCIVFVGTYPGFGATDRNFLWICCIFCACAGLVAVW